MPAIRARWGWLLLAITTALAGFAFADPAPEPPYTVDAIMFPCENRLHFYPKISTNIGASHSGSFHFRVVSAADRGTAYTTGRTFTRSAASRDEFETQSRYLDVTWSSLTEPHLQAINDSGDEVGWFRIPRYTGMSFAGGSGSVGNPYLVSNATQFQQIVCLAPDRQYFRLTRDIDLSGRRFLPIGDTNDSFRGGIDGAGYAIRNMNIDLPEHPSVGLISAAYESFIRNVRFVDPTVRGKTYVGILYGEGYQDYNIVVENVTIEGGFVSAREKFGGLAGRIQDATFVNVDVDVELQFSVNYHGAETYSSQEAGDGNLDTVGGFVGEMDESTISRATLDVSITMDPRMTWIDVLSKTAGLIGATDEEIGIDRVTANVFMDLTVESTGSSSQTIGGLMGDYLDTVILTNSSAVLDVTLRSPANADGKTLQDIGGITGYVEEVGIAGLDLSGTITLDTRASLSTVTVQDVGGAFGQTEGYPTMLNDSLIDVDVIILGRNATVQHVGGLVGEAERVSAVNVRVDGRVHVEATGTNIGGLVGDRDGFASYRTFTGVIYRGEGVSVGSGSTNVGALWGFQGQVQGASVFWDRNRNGISTFDENELGRPARSSELGDMTWLIENGFDPDSWCVTTEDGVSIPAVKLVTPACGGSSGNDGNDGGNGGGVITLPAAPTTLIGTPGNTTARLTWTAPTGVIDAYVLQSRTPGSSWRTQSTTPCDTATCAIATNLTNAQPTDFRIAAENQAGRGPWSNVITITPGTTPTAPTNLTAAPGDGAATLTWTPPTDDGGYPITGYTIEITNTIGMSAWSNVVTVQPNRTPTAPTNLTATPGDAQVTLTWQAPSTGGNPTYQIDVSSNGGSTWTPANATPCNPASPTCAIIGGLTNGTPYTFRVTATTTAGVSPAAGPITATPQAPADVPVITRVIQGANRAWFTITTPTAATAGHELSLDAGVTWQGVTPHVGHRVFRVTNLSNGVVYPAQLRSVRSDGSRSPATTLTLMPTPIRPTAPELSYAIDPATLDVTEAGDTLMITVDLIITNAGSIPLNDVWLNCPNAPILDLTPVDPTGTWIGLDDWWYGENVDLAPGATHRVRVTMETQP
jgi:hypothetical protein